MAPKVTCQACQKSSSLLDFAFVREIPAETFYKPSIHELLCLACGGITRRRIPPEDQRASRYSPL